MAVIKIGNIKATPQKAINYAISDKKELHKKDDIRDSKEYVTRDKLDGKTIYKTLNTPMYCTIENAPQEWENVRKAFKKDNKILMFHVKQNFGIDLDPKISHEIGCKLAKELFSDHQCIVSTHTNTDYTHNHIIFNSVSFATGKKYYDTLGSYKKMREVSDRLCEEYGLPVLEDTKDFKLVKFIGDNGKVKYYEPTKRKDELKKGEYSNKTDYRNTHAYVQGEKYKLSNKQIIKNDIDHLLPAVSSYDELLEKMRGIGYEVRSKKVNGDWLKNISFKAPMQERFTRDSSIGHNYTREYLETFFIEQAKKKQNKVEDLKNNNKIIKNIKQPKMPMVYKYGTIDIDNIDLNYRNNKGSKNVVLRTAIEKNIIIDTKKLNKELHNKYLDSIENISEDKEIVLRNKKNQYLLDCINSNLKTLQFVEDKNIQSFNQINTIITILYEKERQAKSQLDNVKKMLESANENIVIINKYNILKNQIQNTGYNNNLFESDLENNNNLLNTYKVILTKRNLIDPIQQQEFINKVDKYNKVFDNLSSALRVVKQQIKEYDHCVSTLNRIDKEGTKLYQDDINKYYESKKENIREKNNNNKER